MNTDKSLIRNRNLVKQVLDFTGLQNGKMHPSDIDAVLEYDNDALILMEVKRKGRKIPTGQRLLLERLNDSWHNQDKAIVLKVVHQFDDENMKIPIEQCSVEMCYYKGAWNRKEGNLKDILNKLGEAWEVKKLRFG
jgi:hypothetical protein